MAKLTLPLSIATLAAGLAPSARGGDDVRCFEEMVPMRDGTRLYTYGVLPPEGAKCGIVFMRTPYAEEKPVDVSSWAADQRSALARGYAYVVQHVRGTGMSEGAWFPYEDERDGGPYDPGGERRQ